VIDVELIATKDLVKELQGRFDSCLIFGLTINEGDLTYHRVGSGRNNWAFMPMLSNEIDSIKNSIRMAPDVVDPIDWGKKT